MNPSDQGWRSYLEEDERTIITIDFLSRGSDSHRHMVKLFFLHTLSLSSYTSRSLMAEPQPSPDVPMNGATTTSVAGGVEPIPSGPTSKRQRRPSVRLGDIGDPIPHEAHPRRLKQWKVLSDSHTSKPPSRTRHVTTVSPSDEPVPENNHHHETLNLVIKKGLRDGKSRRGAPAHRRPRTNWISKPDDPEEAADLKSSGGEETGDEPFREGSENRDGDAPSETDGGYWNEDRNGMCRLSDDSGVRSWLDRLGLARYAPAFEIHEVDEEVLPFLTLEDLKDMGINAVGSRRKMYSAIQKLRKSFT